MTGQIWWHRLSDAELLAWLIWGEARGEPLRGQVAVASVVANRQRSPYWANSWRGVMLQPQQFDGLSSIPVNPIGVGNRYLLLAKMTMDELLVDPTDGANHFCRHDAHPYWRKLFVFKCRIGDHVFFKGH